MAAEHGTRSRTAGKAIVMHRRGCHVPLVELEPRNKCALSSNEASSCGLRRIVLLLSLGS
jgi:hypothetical protein